MHERAGTVALPSDLVDIAHLVTAYYTGKPDPDNIDQQVAFGTSGHRGTSLKTAFNEDHILATTQAIVDYRREQGFDGPLFIGRDTHGLSEPAWASRRTVTPSFTSMSRMARAAMRSASPSDSPVARLCCQPPPCSVPTAKRPRMASVIGPEMKPSAFIFSKRPNSTLAPARTSAVGAPVMKLIAPPVVLRP